MDDGAGVASLREALRYFRDGALPEAEAAARAELAQSPASVEAWNLLGVVLRTDGRVREALACYRRALLLDQGHAGAWTNLGNAWKDLGHIETAIACHRRALAVQPDAPALWHNLGIAQMGANRHDVAASAYSRALLLDPAAREVRWDRALALLSTGRWAEGWVDYGARIGGPGLPRRSLPGKPWNGRSAPEATLLVVAEQGFGDALWCWRYLPLVRRRVGRLVLECRPELLPLAEAQGFADAVVAQGDALPDADLHCYQCTLPGFFTVVPAEIPPAPYLVAGPGRGERFTEMLSAGAGQLRVGIIWSGSPTFKTNAERSAPLWRFVDSFATPGVALYSLQMGPQRQELAALPDAPVTDLAPHLRDFADTAAVVAALDLVIMTDSAVAHLCGALGRPAWVLLPFSPYWMWGENETSPWYRSLRLFRQPARGDWTSVFDAAGAALMALLAERAEGVAAP